jgi:diketogulonate reductase-like aldo/keto reductase
MNNRFWSRRETIKAAIALGLSPAPLFAEPTSMLTRPIPASGESLPVIGLGTWQVFDVAGSAEELALRQSIIDLLVEKGGRLIDTSPMYARAEKVVGDVLAASKNRDQVFLATKVWTNGKASGKSQMQRSAELMKTEVIDLMQVHNLRDLDVHMGTIRERQQDNLIRYSGITDYRSSELDEIEDAMRKYKPQFVQINYSLAERDADKRMLPVARDLGIAVLINRPFVEGRLFRAVAGQELPDWASDFAASWGQFFLKFIISHPAVTCAIPATSKLHHMADNLGAGFGGMPDEGTRRRMAAFVDAL